MSRQRASRLAALRQLASRLPDWLGKVLAIVSGRTPEARHTQPRLPGSSTTPANARPAARPVEAPKAMPASRPKARQNPKAKARNRTVKAAAPQTTAKQATAPACPHCKTTMVLKVARTGSNAGGHFWGCSGYPQCRGIRVFAGASPLDPPQPRTRR